MYRGATRSPARCSLIRTPITMRRTMRSLALLLAVAIGFTVTGGLVSAEEKAGPNDDMPPPGFTALFNGKDLTGWQGLVDIRQRSKLTPAQLAKRQQAANEKYLPHW